MRTVGKLFLGRWGFVWGLLAAALVLAGCQSQSQYADVPGVAAPVGGSSGMAPPANPAPPVKADTTDTVDYLHAGDMVTVNFSDLPYQQPSIEQRIRNDGTITLIQNQTFNAAGKTTGELEKEIRDRYVPKFFVNMTVSVLHSKESQFYYVGGEVKTPGRQVYISRITVLGAIKSAGDFTDFAKKTNVQLTRADGRTFRINCKQALKNPKLDLEVFPGDNITVFRRNPWDL